MPFEGIRVEGLKDLRSSFRELSRSASAELQESLADAADPVRAEAEHLAAERIRNVNSGDPWGLMRVGMTADYVSVPPKQRGRRNNDAPGKRPNLAGLLLDRALEPALDEEGPRLAGHVEAVLNGAIRHAGF